MKYPVDSKDVRDQARIGRAAMLRLLEVYPSYKQLRIRLSAHPSYLCAYFKIGLVFILTFGLRFRFVYLFRGEVP